jgi:hypothetical protein
LHEVCMKHNQKKMKTSTLCLVFIVYTNFAYRQFTNTLTDGLQNVVRNQVSKFDRWSDGVGVGDDNNSNNITYYYY